MKWTPADTSFVKDRLDEFVEEGDNGQVQAHAAQYSPLFDLFECKVSKIWGCGLLLVDKERANLALESLWCVYVRLRRHTLCTQSALNAANVFS